LALLQYGHVEAGISELTASVEIREDPGYLELLGDAYAIAVRDYPRAVQVYRRSLELSTMHPGPEIHGKLARTYAAAGDFETAGRVIEAGKGVAEGDPGYWMAQSYLLWKQGRMDEARAALQGAVAITRSDPARLLEPFLGDPAEARRMLADVKTVAGGAERPP
jgi:tetratricopeptide (TPR) repeat protein